MGNCLINVHVTGSHHNGIESDIDQMAARFVDELKAKGHNVTAATLVSGGENDMLPDRNGRFPLRKDRPDFYQRG